MELGTFTRSSSSHDTSDLSTRRSSTTSFIAICNAYFAYPENLILAMMTDHRPHTRELALRRLMKARAEADPNGQIRRFKVPAKLNFNALEYFDMIDWAVCPISEPPVIKAMTDTELRNLITTEVTPTVPFLKFPSHTQAVERHVKLVTKAPIASCLWTEIARWLHPCTRPFSIANADVRVKT